MMANKEAGDQKLLEVKDLCKYFPVGQTLNPLKKRVCVQAVDGVSFFVRPGETFGLVGESGCGKSTTGRLILRLIEATSGEIRFLQQDLLTLSQKEMRSVRKDMQIIFQDPYASLNPRMSVGDLLAEPFTLHKIAKGKDLRTRVTELLSLVGLDPRYARRYPHEFSGGQRQRISIARALALRPKLIICDEPVSALDVSIQAQIINLMQDLQDELGLSYIFIAHDLGVVRHISDRVAVMYLGKIVELASKHQLYESPKHPYTQALLSAIPVPDPKVKTDSILLKGDVPSPINPPSGCRFHTRCWEAKESCRSKEPTLKDTGGEHLVACHLLASKE